MAEEIGTLVRLDQHCRRRVAAHLEQLAEQDLSEGRALRARVAADAIDQELHRHIEQVLEFWRHPPLWRLQDGRS